MHDAILDALDDGYVSPKEQLQITNMMKRALGNSPFGKKMVKKVVEALSDNDLSEEDMDLLESILPPEPIDDWKRILENFEKEFGFLKTLFRFYALQGTSGDDDVEDMGKQQFLDYAAEIQVLDKSSVDLNAGCIDRIFIRANQDRTGGIDIFDRENQGRKMKEKAGEMPATDNEMELKEFVCANLRLAHAKYRELPSLADRWEKMLEENIKPFAQIGDLEDEVTLLLESKHGREFIAHYLPVFETLFTVYSQGENERDDQGGTMNMGEFMKFLTDAGLLGDALTQREARGIFVQVNLDDDLYVQDDADQGNSSSELVLDEFMECLVRVAMEIEGYSLGDASEERREKMLFMMEDFIHKYLANKAFGKVKKKVAVLTAVAKLFG